MPRADTEGNVTSNIVVVKGAPAAVDMVIEKLQAFVHRAVRLCKPMLMTPWF